MPADALPACLGFFLPLCLLLWGGVYGCLAMPCLPAIGVFCGSSCCYGVGFTDALRSPACLPCRYGRACGAMADAAIMGALAGLWRMLLSWARLRGYGRC